MKFFQFHQLPSIETNINFVILVWWVTFANKEFHSIPNNIDAFTTTSQRLRVHREAEQLQVTYPTHCSHGLQSLPPCLLSCPLEMVDWRGGPGTLPVSAGSGHCHTEGLASLTY